MSKLAHEDRIALRINPQGKTYVLPSMAMEKADEALDVIRGRARCSIYPVMEDIGEGAEKQMRVRYQLHFHNFTDPQDAMWLAQKGHFVTN